MSKSKTLIKTALTPIALCLTLTMTGPANAKKNHHQEHNGLRQILSELSLTDTQKQDIRQVMKQPREDRDLFYDDAKSLKTELRGLVQSAEWDQTAIENVIIQRQTLIQEKAAQRATSKNQIWNLLTETQQLNFVSQVEERKAEHETIYTRGKRIGQSKGDKLKRLALSEEQLFAVKNLKTAAKTMGAETKARLTTYRKAERSLIQSSEFTPETWQSLNSEYQSDFHTMAVLKAKTQYDIWNILTPEQQAIALKKPIV